MHHLTTADKSLLVGDEAADVLMRYAAHVARIRSADTVQLRAISTDGNEVTATFLLNSGTVLVIESTNSLLREPDNSAAVAYMIAQLGQFDLGGQQPFSPDMLDEGER